MNFLNKELVIKIITQAILDKQILSIKYQRVGDCGDIVTRIKAPFDIGTTNLEKIESNKNNLYAYSYNHKDKKTGLIRPMVNAINIQHIISVEPTGDILTKMKSLIFINLIQVMIIAHVFLLCCQTEIGLIKF